MITACRDHLHLARPPRRFFAPPGLPHPANDNWSEEDERAMLHASLRLFGRFGLGAARVARDRAKAAFFSDEREGYRYWLAIARLLDARVVDEREGVAPRALAPHRLEPVR